MKTWTTSRLLALGILAVDAGPRARCFTFCLPGDPGGLQPASLALSHRAHFAALQAPRRWCWRHIFKRAGRRTPGAASCMMRRWESEKSMREKGETMEKIFAKRLGNLLSVKSLVTLILTGVFAFMAVSGKISQDFMTVYAVVIAFYFGTQSQKVQDAVDQVVTDGHGQ